MAKTYCLLRVTQTIENEDLIFLEKKIPKSTNLAFIKKYICHVINKDMSKVMLLNQQDNQQFENHLKKAEDYED